MAGVMQAGRGGKKRRLNAEINVVPYIDVMLVLLVIFIITAPLLTNAVKIDLPQASSSANLTRPDNVQLAIDAGGQIYWNGEAVDRAGLDQRLRDAGQRNPAPELHVHADKATRGQQGRRDAHRLRHRPARAAVAQGLFGGVAGSAARGSKRRRTSSPRIRSFHGGVSVR